jgi:hypothetical protein
MNEEQALEIAREMQQRGCRIRRFRHAVVSGKDKYEIHADVQDRAEVIKSEKEWQVLQKDLDMWDAFHTGKRLT